MLDRHGPRFISFINVSFDIITQTPSPDAQPQAMLGSTLKG